MALFRFPEFRSEVDSEDVVDLDLLVVEVVEDLAPPVPAARVQFTGLYLLAGDFRGHYGYGRPSHKSDPGGTYGFRPVNRLLPPRGRR